jgi:low temperature requirement protein LtrA
MSVAIDEAFGGRVWLFVAAYLPLQVGRAVFFIVALRGRALGDHRLRRHCRIRSRR